jgi:hypothetical protein
MSRSTVFFRWSAERWFLLAVECHTPFISNSFFDYWSLSFAIVTIFVVHIVGDWGRTLAYMLLPVNVAEWERHWNPCRTDGIQMALIDFFGNNIAAR